MAMRDFGALSFPPPGNQGHNVKQNGGPQFGACLILAEKQVQSSSTDNLHWWELDFLEQRFGCFCRR